MKKKRPDLYLVSSTPEVSGVLTHVRSLSRLSLNSIDKSIVVLPSASADHLFEEDSSIRIYLSYDPRKIIPTWISTWKFLNGTGSNDIIHLHGRLPLLAFAPAIVLRKRRFLYTFHQFFSDNLILSERIKLLLEICLAMRIQKLICVSEALQNQIYQRFGLHAEFIPNWISLDSSIIGVSNGARKARNHFVYLGRLAKEKNPFGAIDGIANLPFKAYLDIYGDGPLNKDVKGRIRDLKLESFISIHPATQFPFEVLKSYHCIIIPSKSESFGLIALEAIACGVFILAPDIPGIRQTLEGFRYISFNPYDNVSITEAIRKYLLLSTEDLINATEYNKILLKSRFSEAIVSEKYEEIYAL